LPVAEEDIKRCVGEKLSGFKVPTRVFVTDALPKGPTGKISRRFMVDAFINKKKEGEGGEEKKEGSEGAAEGEMV
jgi:acyl-coenzyme A synthetase/AMP-(fatty) acid ligase